MVKPQDRASCNSGFQARVGRGPAPVVRSTAERLDVGPAARAAAYEPLKHWKPRPQHRRTSEGREARPSQVDEVCMRLRPGPYFFFFPPPLFTWSSWICTAPDPVVLVQTVPSPFLSGGVPVGQAVGTPESLHCGSAAVVAGS